MLQFKDTTIGGFSIRELEIPGDFFSRPTSKSKAKPQILKDHVEMFELSPSRFQAVWSPMFMEEEYAMLVVDYFQRTHPSAKIISVNHSQVRGGTLPLGISVLCLHYCAE